jgi:UDP-N-acetyl-D-glucosamine dehydrogenase
MSPAAGSVRLAEAIQNKTAKVGVIGLGYVGLPLIQAFVKVGYQTLGYDVDRRKVEALLGGESYIRHIDSHWIQQCLADNQFVPTADMHRLSEADVLLICVPTPLSESRDPDLSFIVATGERIAAALRPGQLIILESTTYPGTTRDVLLPVLEQSGLHAGVDFFVAYSPEREDPGNANYTASGIPKVVGGLDETSGELARLLYSQAIVQIVPVSSAEVAEACKILENTYRAVNIALVNELKMLFDKMGLDVWEVIQAAQTKPFGFQAFYPGPGLGGHCIPIDPFYLTWLARKHGMATRFIELAGEINTRMPQYVVDKVVYALNDRGKPLKGSRVCLLGVAYKKDVDDPRESPAFELMELLLAAGAELSYSDPHIPHLPQMRRHKELPAMESRPLTGEFLAEQDCVVIVTDHSAVDYDKVVRHARLVVDTRNATRNVTSYRDRIVKA